MIQKILDKLGYNAYLLALIISLVIWGTSIICIKISYSSFPPITLAALRFVIASIILGVIVVIKKEFVIPDKKDLKVIGMSGFLGITLYYVMENIGISMTTASDAAIITASYPITTVFMEYLVYKNKISKMKGLGILLGVVGVWIISDVNLSYGGPNQFIGDIILVGTGVVWSVYIFVTRDIVNKYSALTFSFYQTLAGTITLIPLALFEVGEWRVPTQDALFMLIYLSIFCSIVAFMLYNFALRKVSATTTVSMMNILPLSGIILSIIVLGETITPNQIIGGMAVLIGVTLSAK